MAEFNQELKNWFDQYYDLGWIAFPVVLFQGDDMRKQMKPIKWENMKRKTAEYLLKETSDYTGLALKTGPETDLFVIDIDVKDAANGFETLKKHGVEFPEDTPCAVTPSGGHHYFFKYPKDINGWNGTTANKTAGIDTRGHKGLIFCVPNKHFDYDWIVPPSQENLRQLSPENLLRILQIVGKDKETSQAHEHIPPGNGKSFINLSHKQKEIFNAKLQVSGSKKVGERSEADYDLMMWGIRCGMSKAAIYEQVKDIGKFADTKDQYFEITYRGALKEAQAEKVVSKENENTTFKPNEIGNGDPLSDLNDIGNAKRMRQYFGDKIRYNCNTKMFHIWNDVQWKIDVENEILELSQMLPEKIISEAENLPRNSKEYTSYLSHAAATSRLERRNNAIKDLSVLKGIKLLNDAFDSNPLLLNVNNCIIDLEKVEDIPHDPNHLITELAPVDFVPTAKCEKFNEFLKTIFDGDNELIEFVVKALAYSLTGDVSERIFFILWGKKGFNGKSTLLNIMFQLLGDYAASTPFSTFLMKKNEGIPNDIAALNGVRFVTASEAPKNSKFNESLVKQLTGDDPITARFMRSEFFTFIPKFKIFLAANNLPKINATDQAIFDRVMAIPFDVRIPEDKRIKGYHKEIFEEESSGILNRLLDGLRTYHEDEKGLNPPERVKMTTNAYRSDNDIFSKFIDQHCELANDAEIKSSEIYKRYCQWCEAEGLKPWSNVAVSRELEDRDFTKVRRVEGNIWIGIKLKSEF